jgi:hypothetical protein
MLKFERGIQSYGLDEFVNKAGGRDKVVNSKKIKLKILI